MARTMQRNWYNNGIRSMPKGYDRDEATINDNLLIFDRNPNIGDSKLQLALFLSVGGVDVRYTLTKDKDVAGLMENTSSEDSRELVGKKVMLHYKICEEGIFPHAISVDDPTRQFNRNLAEARRKEIYA